MDMWYIQVYIVQIHAQRTNISCNYDLQAGKIDTHKQEKQCQVQLQVQFSTSFTRPDALPSHQSFSLVLSTCDLVSSHALPCRKHKRMYIAYTTCDWSQGSDITSNIIHSILSLPPSVSPLYSLSPPLPLPRPFSPASSSPSLSLSVTSISRKNQVSSTSQTTLVHSHGVG